MSNQKIPMGQPRIDSGFNVVTDKKPTEGTQSPSTTEAGQVPTNVVMFILDYRQKKLAEIEKAKQGVGND